MTASTGRVLVIGGGFGGLQAARGLARSQVAVTLVDRRNFHTFQPLLYQVATAGLEPGSVAYPLRAFSRRRPLFEARMGTVTGADLSGRVVFLDDGSELTYDFLVLAVGAVTSDFGIRGVAEHAFTLKSLTDAVRLRSHLLTQFELAETHLKNPESGATTVVVVGGGPTGVELCGGLSELIHGVLARDHPHLDLSNSRIVLVEANDRLLGGFHRKSAATAAAALTERGIEVRLATAVAEVDPDGVVLAGGERILARTTVWTAGVRASPLAKQLGLALSRSGRIEVGPDLSVAGRPEVFVVGDLAGATDKSGRPFPQLAPVAMQQGRYVARAIAGRQQGRPLAPFRYLDKGTMATIGRNAAVAELPFGLRLRGRLAWWAWLVLHLTYLAGFRNRAATLLDWGWNYVTYQWGARLILPMGSDDPVPEPGRTSTDTREEGS